MASNLKKIFLGVMGAPYESELTTTLFRIVDEAINQGHCVTVWTCGGATTLTQKSLGETKPFNFLDLAKGRKDLFYPTTATLVKGLLKTAGGRLHWYVCRHCMEERGAISHIEGVKVQSPFHFRSFFEEADISMMIGTK